MHSKATVAAALLLALSTASLCRADDSKLDIKDEPAVAKAGGSPKETTADKIAKLRPTTPWKATSVKLPPGSLGEQFASVADFEKHWVPSRAQKEDVPSDAKVDDDNKDHWRYIGKWAAEEATELNGAHPGDLGLVLKSAAKHHAISRKLEKPINFSGKKRVTFQYEVKLQSGLECGGAYAKLLSHSDNFSPSTFSDKSPYTIMFGPDKCGATNKVHFIFRHKNKKTGKINEHHLKNPPIPPSTFSKETHLYTLIVFPEDNKYEIQIDNESKASGSLLEDFEPPVVPPKEIDDPNDKKPADWVDEAKIPDPDAKKPEDWDEDAPLEIEDMDAEKPSDWLEDEAEYVPDPEAKQPEDWDTEEDGEWAAPTIANPKCASVSGCGPWKRPMKRNPDYKGKWSAPLIDNPAYKGPWAPRKIPNPDYVDEKNPGNMTPIGAIGFELWTMQDNMFFDNILLSDSISAATLKAWTQDTWETKHKVELDIQKVQNEETELTKEKETAKKMAEGGALTWQDQLAPANLQKFVLAALADPARAITDMPISASAIGAAALTLIGMFFSLLFGSSSKPAAPQKKVDSASPSKSPSASPSKKSETASATGSAAGSPSKDELKKRNAAPAAAPMDGSDAEAEEESDE